MKTKRLLSALILSCLLPPNVLADIYQDPKTKVNYEYTVGASTASVKAGDGRSFPDGTILDYAGSPDVTGDIVILSNFTIDGNEYTVTSIGGCAFLDCTGLTSVTIPNSVTSIGLSAFSGSGLTSVTIPNSVTSIGLAAFHSCSGLTSVTIPNSVTAIGLNTFRNCTGLTSITIPNSVTSIDNGAFKGCSGLTSIAIPNSVTSIGGGAFTGTGWYENQPDGILYLDNWLIDYKGAEPTGEIVIKEGTKGIADAVFYNCSGLTSITIPNSVANIGFAAFYITGWYNNQPDGILYLDNWLIGYKGEKPSGELVIKEGTKGTAASTFENCTGLTSITIPNSMTSIGRAAMAAAA